jgi:hypothetical protein
MQKALGLDYQSLKGLTEALVHETAPKGRPSLTTSYDKKLGKMVFVLKKK